MNCLWRRIARPTYSLLMIKPEIRAQCLHTVVSRQNVLVSCTFTNLSFSPIFHSPNRYKSKKAQYDSDDEEVLDDDSSLSKDSKLVKLNTTSLRIDLILKSALGIARNKIEQHFYESRIRVNGKKILKKSISVKVGDEIDIVKMVSPKNPDHLYVSRVEVLNIAAKEESIAITARRFKSLLIENYEEDPFTGNIDPEAQQ